MAFSDVPPDLFRAGPVEVSFDTHGADEVERVFRAFELALPELEPGEYTLHVRLERPGREPVTSSRPLTIEG